MSEVFKFTAPKSVVLMMGALAVRESSAAGLGVLHASPLDNRAMPADLARHMMGDELRVDYFNGRMVKLYIGRDAEHEDGWVIHGRPRLDYQSWAVAYPTFEALLEAARWECRSQGPGAETT